MKVTLYRNGPASLGGTPEEYRCAEIDVQGAIDAGNFRPYYGNSCFGSVTDDEGRIIPILSFWSLTNNSSTDFGLLTAVSELAAAHDIVPAPPPPADIGTGYKQQGFSAINTQPSDWALHCRDYYYTEATESGTQYGDLIYYQGVYTGTTDPTFSPCYKNETQRRLFWTANDNYFGAWRGLRYDSIGDTLNYIAGAAYGAGNQSDGGGAHGTTAYWSNARINGVAGAVANKMTYSGQDRYFGTSYEGGSAINSGDALRLVMVHFWYNDNEYIGIMTVVCAADGLPYRGNLIAWGVDFFSAGADPEQPGDYGAVTGGIKPNAQALHSSDVGLSPISGALQRTSWGSTGKGINAWLMTAGDYDNLCSAIWEQNFVDRLMKWGKNPGEGILAVHMVPRGYTYYAEGAHEVSSYGVKLGFYSNKITYRIYDVDFASIQIPGATGQFTDYEGATCSIYLPFCGSYTLDMKKVCGSTLHLKYRIDAFTGDCVAVVTSNTAYPPGVTYDAPNSVLLTVTGNCAVSVPYSYSDGGVQAKLSMISGAFTTAISAASGNVGGIVAGGMQMIKGGGERISASTASGNPGAFGHLQPFVWLTYPDPLNPAGYAGTVGRKSGYGGTVGTADDDSPDGRAAAGLQRFLAVDVDGIDGATQEELQEIETLLKGGIFV